MRGNFSGVPIYSDNNYFFSRHCHCCEDDGWRGYGELKPLYMIKDYTLLSIKKVNFLYNEGIISF
jgi:hypothetical protein